MLTRLLLFAALSACAPAYSLKTHREPPVWLYAADMAAFSAGCIVGLGEFNRPGPPYSEPRDKTLMYSAFAVALASWGPYWIVSTSPRPTK